MKDPIFEIQHVAAVLLVGGGIALITGAESIGHSGGGGRGEVENSIIGTMLFGGGAIAVGVVWTVVLVVVRVRGKRR